MFTINDFRKNLTRERAKKWLSAYELSLRIGKDKGYISGIENRYIPSLTTIFDICEVLEIEPKTLFDKKEK